MKRTLDWLCFLLLMCGVMMLSGCAVLDWLFIPNKGQNPGDTPGALLGTIINYIIPGAGALVATAGAVYGKVRGSTAIKEREAHEATLGAIKEATAGGGAVDAVTLDNAVKAYHKEAGTELIHENIQAALEAST